MPNLYMLIGVPGSGKSTWRSKHKSAATVASSDDYLDAVASNSGTTYNEVFKDHIKAANDYAIQSARAGFERGDDVIWDQTNTSRKSRASKLAMVPDNYRKVAVFFPTPSDLKQRLASRKGKTIPEPIILSMINTLEPPTKDEGFDEILTVS